MTGEDLYGLWTAKLREQWSDSEVAAIFRRSTNQPATKPVAWAFLTDAEQHAWDALAPLWPTPEAAELLTDERERLAVDEGAPRCFAPGHGGLRCQRPVGHRDGLHRHGGCTWPTVTPAGPMTAVFEAEADCDLIR